LWKAQLLRSCVDVVHRALLSPTTRARRPPTRTDPGSRRTRCGPNADGFLDSLATHLATYALGRELGLADRPLVAGAVADMDENGATLRNLIKAIVTSDAFATK
jgi:hypothetical protein